MRWLLPGLLACLCGWAAAQAEQYSPWQDVEANPQDPAAWLELGMHYCDEGAAEAALRIFRLIEERFAPPPGIRALIAHQRAGGCRLPARNDASRTLLRLSVGHDDNPSLGLTAVTLSLLIDGVAVELPLSAQSRPRPDAWRALDLVWLGAGSGWRPFVQMASRRYLHEHDVDFEQFVAGLGREENGESWRLWAGRGWLGGERALDQFGMQGGAWPSDWKGLGWEASLAAVSYPRHSQLDALQFETRLLWRPWHDAGGGVVLGFGWFHDQPRDERRPGGRRGGATLQLRATTLLDGWRIQFQHRQAWLADEQAYSPLFGDMRRHTRETRSQLELIWPLSDGWQVVASLQHYRSRDRVPLFDYAQNLATVSLEYLIK